MQYIRSVRYINTIKKWAEGFLEPRGIVAVSRSEPFDEFFNGTTSVTYDYKNQPIDKFTIYTSAIVDGYFINGFTDYGTIVFFKGNFRKSETFKNKEDIEGHLTDYFLNGKAGKFVSSKSNAQLWTRIAELTCDIETLSSNGLVYNRALNPH